MRRLLTALVFLATLAVPASVAAHPLGNFTVNRFSAIEFSGERLYVHYVLDLAEIPTFQEGEAVRRRDFALRVERGLVLRIAGRRVRLRAVEDKLTERRGAGGLPTLRFEAVYEPAAPVRGSGEQLELVFQDTNYGDRIGWKEVVVAAEGGAEVISSTAPSRSVSDALRSYPENLLRAPLDVSSARATFEPGSVPATPPALGAGQAGERPSSGFESLVSRDDLGLGVVLVSLGVAMFWGAAHALTPGHGKAIVAGYLVGSRGRPRHALALGVIVTVTHTLGVFALGLVTLLLSRFILPERLYPWLTLVSGLLVVGVGAAVLRKRLLHRREHAHGRERHDHGDHGHRRPHDYDHEHGLEPRGLLGVGIAAGLLPCPSALVVLLSAIALHRVGFGLALILAFSVGLAVTISSIGLVAVLARRAFARLRLDGPVFRALPAASALLILAVGVGITLNAVPEVL
jgi:nickel/cobalt transporter (NicO) family protein